MPTVPEFRIETARLALRPWCKADADPFHTLCSDPAVMEFLGPPLSREQIDETITRQQGLQRELGYCFWPVERREDGAFLGFCGLKPGPAGTPLEGRIEIGWRLARHAWGQGYAREAAQASLDWGFANLSDHSVYAMTVLGNVRSWGLMERLGMLRRADLDFDHPALGPDDPLRPHIVYETTRIQENQEFVHAS